MHNKKKRSCIDFIRTAIVRCLDLGLSEFQCTCMSATQPPNLLLANIPHPGRKVDRIFTDPGIDGITSPGFIFRKSVYLVRQCDFHLGLSNLIQKLLLSTIHRQCARLERSITLNTKTLGIKTLRFLL